MTERNLISALKKEEKRLFKVVEDIRVQQKLRKDPLWGAINELSAKQLLLSYRNILEALDD